MHYMRGVSDHLVLSNSKTMIMEKNEELNTSPKPPKKVWQTPEVEVLDSAPINGHKTKTFEHENNYSKTVPAPGGHHKFYLPGDRFLVTTTYKLTSFVVS